MTPEQVGEEHAVASVDTWTADDTTYLRWKCACSYRMNHALEVPRWETPHETLRQSHFRHLRKVKKAAGLL